MRRRRQPKTAKNRVPRRPRRRRPRRPTVDRLVDRSAPTRVGELRRVTAFRWTHRVADPEGERVRRRRCRLSAAQRHHATAGRASSRRPAGARRRRGAATVKLLHTSDWHVGKAIRGASRADEHRAVLAEIAGDRRGRGGRRGRRRRRPVRHVDAVAGVRGDRLPGAARASPARGADRRRDRRQPRQRPRACAPSPRCSSSATSTSSPNRPAPTTAACCAITTARRHADVRLAMLPFVSKRGIVRAADLMDAEAFENAQRYSDRLRLLIEALCAPFHDDTVNVLAAHAFVLGAATGRRRATGPPRRRVRRHRRSRSRRPSATARSATSTAPQRIPAGAGAALLRLAAAARLRRGRAGQAGQRRHDRARRARRRPRRARSRRAGALRTVTRHDRRARRARRRRRPVAARRRARRRAGPAWPTTCAELLGPRVVDVRVDAPDAGDGARPTRPPRPQPAGAVRRVPRRARASTTTGSGRCSPSCSTTSSTVGGAS